MSRWRRQQSALRASSAQESRSPSGPVLIAHPSPDVYGSDLQMVQTVRGLVSKGLDVVVVMPARGELTAQIEAAGGTVVHVLFPVLRKADLSPAGLVSSAVMHLRSLLRLCTTAKNVDPAVAIVNTVTIPIWLVVLRIMRIPSICHVHEAEEGGRKALMRVLLAPLFLAHRIVTNSNAASRAILAVYPRLAERSRRIYNGVPTREAVEKDYDSKGADVELLFVGRISPRKGPDTLIRAVGKLIELGWSVQLSVVGSVFPGYEWFEDELKALTADLNLSHAVKFAGYMADPFKHATSDVILVVPSRAEPFGNVAVEGQMLGLAVVASDVQGLSEIVRPGYDGLLFAPDSPDELARQVIWLLRHPDERRQMMSHARTSSRERFGVDRYNLEFSDLIELVTR